MDRNRHMATHTIGSPSASQPIPMLGQMQVEHYDHLLEQRVAAPLTAVKSGTVITASGTITRTRYLDPHGHRVHVVLTHDDGSTGLAEFNTPGPAQAQPLLRAGTRITITGFAVRRHPEHPVIIDAYTVRPADPTAALPR